MDNEGLIGKTPQDILRLAYDEYGDRLMMTTGFGYSGMVLMHMSKEIMPDLPIYFIDTGFHFKQTIDFANKTQNLWNLNVIHLHPDPSVTVDHRNPNDCCYHRKVEPLRKIMQPDDVWLSALRKDQAHSREHTQPLMTDSRGTLKVCPLYAWTKDMCWDYIRQNDIPVNPLMQCNYKSIGCEPCTVPVKEGEDERSGRWKGTGKAGGECGLHD